MEPFKRYNYYLMQFLIILMIFVSISAIFLRIIPSIYDLTIISDFFFRDSKLMIGVIANTNYSSRRVQSLLKTWAPSFLSSPFSSELVICTRNPDDERFSSKITNLQLAPDVIEFWNSIPIPDIGNVYSNWRDRNFIVILRTVTLINHFSSSSNSGWLTRLVDDSYVNIPYLSEMLSHLTKNYDYLSDIVIWGNCIEVGLPFLQGGSGFLLSYKAATVFKSYSLEWIRQMNTFEDFHFSNFLYKIQYPIWNASSPYFLGHLFSTAYNTILKYTTKYPINQCDFYHYHLNKCRLFYAPLSHVVFFHDVDHKLSHLRMNLLLNNYSNNIYFSQPFSSALVCYYSSNQTFFIDNISKSGIYYKK